MPFGLGFGELVIILLIVTVVFGARSFPQIGDSLGKTIRSFRKAVGGGESAAKAKIEDGAKPRA
jgi:sec-independent protein translocase protein TatA